MPEEFYIIDPQLFLQCLYTTFLGVCDATKVRIKAGDMAVLTCPLSSPQNSTRATVKWTSHALNLTSNTPLAQQKQMGVLAHKGNLVILSVSGRHQGNYSCSVR